MNNSVATGVRPQSLAAPFAALVIGAVAMGLSPIFVRLAGVGPFTSAFWRVALALPVLYGWMRISERGCGKPSRRFPRATLWAGAAFSADLFFWHLAITQTTVASATLFATTAPIWVVLFGWFIFRKGVSAGTMLGLGLCILGGGALLAESLHAGVGTALGDLYGLATGVFFGLYFLAVQAARTTHSAARITFEATLITAALLLLAAFGLEHQMLPRTFHGLAALIALAWVSHAGGQGLLTIALGHLPATFSSLVIFLEAIAAACFAWALLGEPITLIQAGGGVMILAGIYVARPR